MMERLKLKLDGATVPQGPLLTLLCGMRDLADKTCIWLFFDASLLLTLLIDHGVCHYVGSSRTFGAPGTAELAGEVYRSVSGTLQFCAAERLDAPVSDLYFAGCPDSCIELCTDQIEALGLRVSRLPECPYVRLFPPQQRQSDWAVCAGAMLRCRRSF